MYIESSEVLWQKVIDILAPSFYEENFGYSITSSDNSISGMLKSITESKIIKKKSL